MLTKKRTLLALVIIFVLCGCGGGKNPTIPPESDKEPPVWDSTTGITNAVPSEDGITVYWGTATDKDSPPVYYLLYMDTDNNPWDKTPIIKPTNAPYKFSGLSENLIYWFGVRCMDSAIPPNVDTNTNVTQSYISSGNGGDVFPPVWDSTIGVVSLDAGGEQVTVHWGTATDANTPPVGYRVYMSEDGYPFDDYFVTLPNNNPYTFTGLENGRTYWFGVRAFDNVKPPNVDSNIVILYTVPDSGGIDDDPPHWDTTIGVTALESDDASITVHWGTATDDETPPVSYLVYLDTDSNPWDQTPVILPNNNPYIFNGVDNKQKYYVGVRCQDSWYPPNIDSNTVVKSIKPEAGAWVRTWGGPMNDMGYHVLIDNDGNLYTAGTFERSVDFNPGLKINELTANGFSWDMYLSKFDLDGNYKWTVTWGATDTTTYCVDSVGGLAFDELGDLYISGCFSKLVDFDPGPGKVWKEASLNGNIYLLKLTKDGEFVWVQTWGNENTPLVGDIRLDSTGNIYLTGAFWGEMDFNPGSGEDMQTSSDFPIGGEDIFLSRFSRNGDYVWTRIWGGQGADFGYDLKIDSLNNVLICGQISNEADLDPGAGVALWVSDHNDNEDCFLSKFSPQGDFLWGAAWGDRGWDYSNSVTVDSFDEVYVVGNFSGDVDFDPGPGEDIHSTFEFNTGIGPGLALGIFLSKFSSEGEYQWARTWGPTPDTEFPTDYIGAVCCSYMNNIYVTGNFGNVTDFDPTDGEDIKTNDISINVGDIFLSHYDINGNYLGAKTWGGADGDMSRNVTTDVSGNIYLTGDFHDIVDFKLGSNTYRRISNGNADVFLMKLNP